MMSTKNGRTRNVSAGLAAVAAALLLMGAAAWACTAHRGAIHFCPSNNTLCAFGQRITPAASSTAYINGLGLLANRNDITVRYALTASPANDDCHSSGTSTEFASGGATDGVGNLTSAMTGTTPSANNWTFCATNGSLDNYSDHLVITLN